MRDYTLKRLKRNFMIFRKFPEIYRMNPLKRLLKECNAHITCICCADKLIKLFVFFKLQPNLCQISRKNIFNIVKELIISLIFSNVSCKKHYKKVNLSTSAKPFRNAFKFFQKRHRFAKNIQSFKIKNRHRKYHLFLIDILYRYFYYENLETFQIKCQCNYQD